jgi:hypothetical protein
MISGAKEEIGRGLTALDRNFDTNLGRAAVGEIFMETWGATLGRNFYVSW